MEAYFTVAKRTSRNKTPNFNSQTYSPQAQRQQVSASTITSKLLETLSDPTNPITHSDIVDRTDHYVACATGHQVAQERTNQRAYMSYREDKLQIQREADSSNGDDGNLILKGIKVYINGYLEGTTDTEIKKVIVQCGGRVVGVASQCTHIVTSRGLSGSKTHRILTAKSCKVYVVRPEWIYDSLAHGKRRPERPYTIMNTQAMTRGSER